MNYRTTLITEKKKDPFGAAMWAYFKGDLQATVKVYSDIAVDDDIPVGYLFRSYSQMPPWEQKAVDLCRGRILDVGAGAGSHSLELQNRGEDTTAIDISPGAVEIMEARGINQLAHASIWEYTDERFDTILLMMNGVGLVGNLKGLNAFLKQAKNMLNQGGQILLDSSDIKYLYEDLEISPPNDIYYGLIEYQMVFGASVGEKFSWLYLDYPRLIRHCKLQGLSCEILHEGPHFEYLARISAEK